jgi:GDPmannose 4,6-dehydratase
MADRTALVTGITGKDGSYLAELLLGQGYSEFGLIRRLNIPNLSNLRKVMNRIELLDGDLMEQPSLNQTVKVSEPSDIYNLAAQSFDGTSVS